MSPVRVCIGGARRRDYVLTASRRTKYVLVLLGPILGTSGCQHSENRHLQRTVRPAELVGSYRGTDSGIQGLDYAGFRNHLDPVEHQLELAADGTCEVQTVVDPSNPGTDGGGKWIPRGTPCQWELRSDRPQVLLLHTDGEPGPSFFLDEEAGRLVLWQYAGDPDAWKYMELTKVPAVRGQRSATTFESIEVSASRDEPFTVERVIRSASGDLAVEVRNRRPKQARFVEYLVEYPQACVTFLMKPPALGVGLGDWSVVREGAARPPEPPIEANAVATLRIEAPLYERLATSATGDRNRIWARPALLLHTVVFADGERFDPYDRSEPAEPSLAPESAREDGWPR